MGYTVDELPDSARLKTDLVMDELDAIETVEMIEDLLDLTELDFEHVMEQIFDRTVGDLVTYVESINVAT